MSETNQETGQDQPVVLLRCPFCRREPEFESHPVVAIKKLIPCCEPIRMIREGLILDEEKFREAWNDRRSIMLAKAVSFEMGRVKPPRWSSERYKAFEEVRKMIKGYFGH